MKYIASSSEAFDRFEIWKNSKTPLKVTLIVGGKTGDVLVGTIIAVDPEASQVGISNRLVMHSFAGFDVEDADFSIEDSRLIATRNESDWIVFEEVAELSRIWTHSMR